MKDFGRLALALAFLTISVLFIVILMLSNSCNPNPEVRIEVRVDTVFVVDSTLYSDLLTCRDEVVRLENVIHDQDIKIDSLSSMVGELNWLMDRRKVRMLYYVNICVANPTQLKFLRGWTNRVFTEM